jgi:hypothetical protein
MSVTIRRQTFMQHLQNKQILLADCLNQPELSVLSIQNIDQHADGQLVSTQEHQQLFDLVDNLDQNGSRHSFLSHNPQGQLTVAGAAAEALFKIATTLPALNQTSLRSVILQNGFALQTLAVLSKPFRGPSAIAVQCALGQLGYYKKTIDGDFGNRSEQALIEFQTHAGLNAHGMVDKKTLDALDQALHSLHPQQTWNATTDAWKAITDFQSLGINTITLPAHSSSWENVSVQKAYGIFVKEYWDAIKQYRVECDCKNLGLLFMTQFRAKVQSDTGISLPMPSFKGNKIPTRQWNTAIPGSSGGLPENVTNRSPLRSEYKSVALIQSLDSRYSLIRGMSLSYPNVSTDQVSKRLVTLQGWRSALDNNGDKRKPELDIQKLEPGHMIMIDHTGDGVVDHMVNVIEVIKDTQNRVTQVRLACGSFDDIRDNQASTSPTWTDVNLYTEEIIVDFDAQGLITQSQVSWTSEPAYASPPRYSERTTLMELKPGGTLSVCRFGQT